MGSYQDLVREEARKFFETHHAAFLDDADNAGGKSAAPNFLKWLDKSAKLNKVVEDIVSKWSAKEFQWVKTNTRNPAPPGGDARSNAFGSFYSDLHHELKKLKKQTASG
jgi:hypothetical protein